MNEAVADDYLGIIQRLRCIDGAEARSAGPHAYGHYIHTHLVDQSGSEDPSANVAGGDFHDPVTCQFPGGSNGRLDAIDKVERALRVPTLWERPMRHNHYMINTGGRNSIPAVHQFEDPASGDRNPNLVPVPVRVVER